MRAVLGGVVDALAGVIGLLFYGFGLLMVTIYALADARPVRARHLQAVPRRRRPDARELAHPGGHPGPHPEARSSPTRCRG